MCSSRQKLGVTGTPTFFINGVKLTNTLAQATYLDATIQHFLEEVGRRFVRCTPFAQKA